MIGLAGVELAILFFSGLFGSMGAPLGISPAAEDPKMMAVAPAECLAYTTWWGMVPPAGDGNVSERWMAQPELSGFLEKLTNLWRSTLAGTADAGASDRLDQAMQLSRHLLTHAGAIYIRKVEVSKTSQSFSMHAGVLANMGDDPSRFLSQVKTLEEGIVAETDLEVSEVDIGDRKFRSVILSENEIEVRLIWGPVSENHFAATVGEGEMESLLARLEGPSPEWLTTLRSRLPVERPTCISRIDGRELVSLVRLLFARDIRGFDADDPAGAAKEKALFESLGLLELRDIGYVGGLDADGFVGRTLIDLEGEPRGLFGLFSDTPIDESQLARIPGDRMLAAAASISPKKVMEFVRAFVHQETRRIDGEGAVVVDDDPLTAEIRNWNAGSGIDFEEDLLANVDSFVFVYGSVNITNPSSGWVFGVGASQSMAITGPFESFSRWVMSEPAEEPEEWAPRYKFSTAETGGTTWYTAKVEQGWSPIGQETCWGLSENEIVMSLDRSSMRRHLRRSAADSDAIVNDAWFRSVLTPPADLNDAQLCFVSSLNVSQLLELAVAAISLLDASIPQELGFDVKDIPPLEVLKKEMKPCLSAMYRTGRGFEVLQRQTYPGGSPLNTLAAVGILALPGAADALAQAVQAEATNNIRQLIIAMHNYHDVYRGLPARFNKNEAGEKLLSWRVHILPFLGEESLYDEFHLDEPWDSEHNRALIERMPYVFRHPRVDTEPGKTCYLALAGEDSAMQEPGNFSAKPVGKSFEQLAAADGTSQTAVMVQVNAEKAVIWTRPDDYVWTDGPDPTSGILFTKSDKTAIGMVDGSVHLLSGKKLRSIAAALFRFNDGEIIDLWSDE